MQTIFLHEIYSKLKTKEDIINYFRENGKFINLIYKSKGLYYPNYSAFNNKFFLDVLAGRKKVDEIILYNLFYYIL